MAGDDNIPYTDPSLKGISRIFNNSTIKGRANVAIATYAGIFLFYIYRKISQKFPKSTDEGDNE